MRSVFELSSRIVDNQSMVVNVVRYCWYCKPIIWFRRNWFLGWLQNRFAVAKFVHQLDEQNKQSNRSESYFIYGFYLKFVAFWCAKPFQHSSRLKNCKWKWSPCVNSVISCRFMNDDDSINQLNISDAVYWFSVEIWDGSFARHFGDDGGAFLLCFDNNCILHMGVCLDNKRNSTTNDEFTKKKIIFQLTLLIDTEHLNVVFN